MPDDLTKIKNTKEDSPKKIINKTSDWWDIDCRLLDLGDTNYRPPDYHTVEDFELFFPKKEKE